MPDLSSLYASAVSSGALTTKIPGPQVTGFNGYASSIGSLTTGAGAPAAAFDDFAIFGLSDPDPAMTFVAENNGGALTGGFGTPSTRNFVVATAPRAEQGSNGPLWPQAAFASVSFKFTGIPANAYQSLDDVMFEEIPVGQTGPSGYENPRIVKTLVKPDRLNLVTNPSFEINTSGWVADAGATLTQVASGRTIGNAGSIVTTSASGISLPLIHLVPGRQYIASAWINRATAGDVSLAVTNGSTQDSETYLSSSAQTYGSWRRISLVFTASVDTDSLHVQIPDAATVLVDDVLVESGTFLQPYFDGSFGVDYLWEVGGTAGLTRSYNYSQRSDKQVLLDTLIADSTPIGITAQTPQFGVMPSSEAAPVQVTQGGGYSTAYEGTF
jgi:hypothetical protein